MSKSVLKSVGSILYRALIGYLVANIITGAYAGLIVAVGMAGYFDSLRATSVSFALMSALASSSVGGLFGAVCASLFARIPPSGEKGRTLALLKIACAGSLLGIIMAAHFGATFATAVDFIYGQEAVKNWGEDFVLVPMAIGGGAGILAGILCAFWRRIRQKHHTS